MRLAVDQDLDIAYLWIADDTTHAQRTYETTALVDLDEQGRIIGVELVDYKGGTVETMTFYRDGASHSWEVEKP